jgi:membrane-associated phospholipid phosphatase
MRILTVICSFLLGVALLVGCTMVVDPAQQTQSSSNPVEPQAANWETWVLVSSDELRPAAPPEAEAMAEEIEELKSLMAQRDPAAQEVVAHWDAGSPSYRWIEMALAHYSSRPPNPSVSRGMALLNVALYDATIATWDAKYAYNRLRPSQVDATLITMIEIPHSPSYPSEHAAAAGAAAVVLAYLFPEDADFFAAMADEAAQSRLLAGVHFPSDVEAGLALGHDVGERVIEWAKADSSDVPWDGAIPTGPGVWQGDAPVFPLAGTWGTWVLSSGDQLRPPAPPAHDSEQILADLAEIKSIEHTFPIVSKAMYNQTFQSAYPDWYELLSLRLFERELDRNPPYAARAYAMFAVTFHDTIVACFDAKYAYWLIRPSQLDPEVTTLFPPPPHPSYPAAHGCVSGAAEVALGALFPAEAERLHPLVEEAATTRIWAGIHYRTDVEVGLALGRDVAQLVVDRVQEMTAP